MRRAQFIVVVSLLGCLISVPLPAQDSAKSTPPFELKEATVSQLVKQLDDAPSWDWERPREPHVELILLELVRRGGEEAKQQLRRRLAKRANRLVRENKKYERLSSARSKAKQKEFSEHLDLVDELSKNLDLETTLRRLESKPDPLTIAVESYESHHGVIKGHSRIPPVVSVAIKNVTDKTPIWIQQGGNYRSGRLARWRVDVWDSDGLKLPSRKRFGWIGGGISTTGYLAPGETWDAKLDLFNYVKLEDPGRYRVQFCYHNHVSIADLSEGDQLNELIMVKSKPLEMEIVKGPMIRIALKSGERKKAEQLIASYDAKQKLRIVRDDYQDYYHDYIAPDSTYGRLLTLGQPALPSLLNALNDEKLSFRKRAWVLAALHTISQERQFDPMNQAGILPSYNWKSMSGSGSDSVTNGSYDQKKQLEFSRRWLSFRDTYVRVSEAGD